MGYSYPRKYTIRKFDYATGKENHPWDDARFKFGAYESKSEAKKELRKILDE